VFSPESSPGKAGPAERGDSGRLTSNLGSMEVALTDEDREALDSLSARVKGARYNEAGMQAVQE
jgi:diketogulonate reductase-like aldo/keto reductase